MTVSVPGTIRALAGSATDWLSGRWPRQEALVEAVSARTGYSLPVVRAGLDAHFSVMNEVALTAWHRRSRGPDAPSGDGRVAILAADNIPGVAFAPAVAALLAGFHAVLKLPAAGDPLLEAWVDAVGRRDAAVGDRLSTRAWSGGSEVGEAVLRDMDVLIVLGRDATIAALEVRHPGRVLGLGTGWSFAVVEETADLDRAAVGLARDVALWDQAGCLSPRGAWFVGGNLAGRDFTRRLAAALNDIERRWPSRRRAVGDDATVRLFRAELEARAAGGTDVECHHPADGATGWTAWSEPAPWDGDPDRENVPAPAGHRAIWVRTAPTRGALLDRLGSASGFPFQGAAIAPGTGSSFDEVATGLRAIGVPHVTRPGLLQSPPIDWPNRGRDLLEELVGRGAELLP